MVKANVIPGKFFSFLLGLLLGIIVALGGLVGGGYYAYKNVKVGTVLKWINQTDWISEKYAQNTVENLIKELQGLTDGDVTLQTFTDISPILGEKLDSILDNVNQNGIVTLDKDALKRTPINQLSTALSEVVIITSTLNSLGESLNFTLPDLPLIQGGAAGNEVYLYTAVNDNENKTIDKAIALGEHTYYTKTDSYEPATEAKITPVFTLRNVTEDEDGYLKQDDKFIYVRYTTSGESGEIHRYYKLSARNHAVEKGEMGEYYFITDEFYRRNALTTSDNEGYVPLNPESAGARTVFEIASPYAYKILYAERDGRYVPATVTENDVPVVAEGGFLIAEEYSREHLYVKTPSYSEVTQEITDEFLQNNTLYVRTNGIGDLPLNFGISALSGTLDVNSLTLNTVGTYFGISLQNDLLTEIMDVPLAYMADSMTDTIQKIQLATVLQLDGSSSSILLYLAYGEKDIDYTIDPDTNEIRPIHDPKNITEVLNSIDTLKIGNIIDTEAEGTHSLIRAVADWTIQDFGKESKINSLTLGDAIAVNEDDPNTPHILKALKDVSLGDFSDKLGTLRLEDMLGHIEESNTVLYALKDCTVNTLAETIGTLAIQDLFAEDIYRYTHVTEAEFDDYPELFVLEKGNYVSYDPDKHDPEQAYARYVIAYKNGETIAGYENIPLYAYRNGEYVLATEVTGWALPQNEPAREYYYLQEGDYVAAEPQNGVYSQDTLYYLNEHEEIGKLELIPARLQVATEFATEKLYSKLRLESPSADGDYGVANLYYFNMETQSFKRADAVYNPESGRYTVSAEFADRNLYTHGLTKGVWRYLLNDENGAEQICTVNNIGSLVSNVSKNINKATLRSLHEDGLIEISVQGGQTPEDLLNTEIPSIFLPNGPKKLGDLSISETISVVVAVIAKLAELPF